MKTAEAEKYFIRVFANEDREGILQLLRATEVFRPHEIEIADEVLQDSLKPASTYHIFCMKTDENQLIGYICWGPTPCTDGTFDLYWIAVHPHFQNHGVGKKLLSFAEDNIRKNRGRLMLIETSSQPTYETTRHFYINNGYKQLAIVPDFYRQGDDKIIYGKTFLS